MKILSLVFFLASTANAYQGGNLQNHSHSSAAGQGGSTLSPVTVNVSGTLTVAGSAVPTVASTQTFSGTDTFAGAVVVSSGMSVFTTDIATQAFITNLSYVTPNTQALGVCMSTLTWSSDGSQAYLELDATETHDAGAQYFCFGALLNSAYTSPFSSTVGTKCIYATNNIDTPVFFRIPITTTIGVNTACLTMNSGVSFNYTMTFAGSATSTLRASSVFRVVKR